MKVAKRVDLRSSHPKKKEIVTKISDYFMKYQKYLDYFCSKSVALDWEGEKKKNKNKKHTCKHPKPNISKSDPDDK